MSDIRIGWNAALSSGDLILDGPDLSIDDGLKTAITISLFTDRRAGPDDILPQEGSDPRGWWGDSLAAERGDQIGSRLWLLAREKQLSKVLVRAREYAEEALAWLVVDGVAASVSVTTHIGQDGVLGIGVVIERPGKGGPARQRYDFVWEAL